MRITIEPSGGHFLAPDGERSQVWSGVTERGIRCEVYVLSIAVDEGPDAEAFERQLLDEGWEWDPASRADPVPTPGAAPEPSPPLG